MWGLFVLPSLAQTFGSQMSPLLACIPKTSVPALVSHGPTVQAFVTKTIVNIHKCVCVCVCVCMNIDSKVTEMSPSDYLAEK